MRAGAIVLPLFIVLCLALLASPAPAPLLQPAPPLSQPAFPLCRALMLRGGSEAEALPSTGTWQTSAPLGEQMRTGTHNAQCHASCRCAHWRGGVMYPMLMLQGGYDTTEQASNAKMFAGVYLICRLSVPISE